MPPALRPRFGATHPRGRGDGLRHREAGGGRRREKLLGALRRLLVEFSDRLFDFNVEAAWARILAAARCAGRSMAVPDGLIAAMAKAKGCALATLQQPGLQNTGLDLVDPWRRAA